MVKKKQSQKNATAIMVDADELTSSSEENATYKDLTDKLAKIRKQSGVVGYIIRNATSAAIDLEEPEKLVEYAIFSSQLMDSSQEISDQFKLGDITSVLIEGKQNKALCMNIEGNKLSVFMEKDADDADILKQISP
jgi:predicted regulator of Ras-like GTPase activity (Roadblock/LC7/MglB family)